jgi:DNA-binding HxlR family transcriptional regulator
LDKLRLDQHLLTQRLDNEEDERLVAVKVVPKILKVSAHLSGYIVVVKSSPDFQAGFR